MILLYADVAVALRVGYVLDWGALGRCLKGTTDWTPGVVVFHLETDPGMPGQQSERKDQGRRTEVLPAGALLQLWGGALGHKGVAPIYWTSGSWVLPRRETPSLDGLKGNYGLPVFSHCAWVCFWILGTWAIAHILSISMSKAHAILGKVCGGVQNGNWIAKLKVLRL